MNKKVLKEKLIELIENSETTDEFLDKFVDLLIQEIIENIDLNELTESVKERIIEDLY